MTEYVRCSGCGKQVSTPVPRGTVIRAWIECPECIESRQDKTKILGEIADNLKEIVCTEGEDKGVVLLAQEAPTHIEKIGGRNVTVYDLEHFSPLGEALIAVYEKAALANRSPRTS